MYEYAWAPGGPGPGYSSGYYVGILQYNDSIGYFLTTQYTNNPNSLGYYDYYYSGSGWGTSTCWKFPPVCHNLNYYFLEDNTGDIRGYSGPYCSKNNQFCDIFAPPDQQNDLTYYQYGVFWLYNWFQADNNNMNIFFLMNGNIFNYSLALEQYKWNSGSAYAIPPMPPGHIFCSVANVCKLLFVQSYINAYNTAFNQSTSAFSGNYQKALYNYFGFTSSYVDANFVPGTFGFKEKYYNSLSQSQSITIHTLQDNISVYIGTPYLFISAGSGGGSGFMYLDWVIVTYGVPYVLSVS